MSKSSSNYRPIATLGSNAYTPSTNPISYCLTDRLDSGFGHGSISNIIGPNSAPCQQYMAQYCSEQWDSWCEAASRNSCNDYPNQVQGCNGSGDIACKGLNLGEALIRNVASEKYLIAMGNCHRVYEPFDPTVPTSPMVSSWKSDTCGYTNNCVPVYAVDPETIDKDVVMDKILARPAIAQDILLNIYNTMKRQGTLGRLKGTKLGHFYDTLPHYRQLGGCSGHLSQQPQHSHQQHRPQRIPVHPSQVHH